MAICHASTTCRHSDTRKRGEKPSRHGFARLRDQRHPPVLGRDDGAAAERELIKLVRHGAEGATVDPAQHRQIRAHQHRQFARQGSASGSENVVSRTRPSGACRARRTARCSATTVLPVPADPETRAGPE